jgi:hypothetical protein
MEQEVNDNQWALFMFVSLSQQAEMWGYALKGTLHQRSKLLLNNYLQAAKMFSEHIKGDCDLDQLHEDSIVWSQLMDYFRSKSPSERVFLFGALQNYFEQMEAKDNHEAWASCDECGTYYDLRESVHCPNCNKNELQKDRTN